MIYYCTYTHIYSEAPRKPPAEPVRLQRAPPRGSGGAIGRPQEGLGAPSGAPKGVLAHHGAPPRGSWGALGRPQGGLGEIVRVQKCRNPYFYWSKCASQKGVTPLRVRSRETPRRLQGDSKETPGRPSTGPGAPVKQALELFKLILCKGSTTPKLRWGIHTYIYIHVYMYTHVHLNV